MDKLSYINKCRLAALTGYGLFPIPLDPTLFVGARDDDFVKMHELAVLQGIDALAFSGVMSLPEALRPNDGLVAEWKGARTRYAITSQWQIRMQGRVLEELKSAGISATVIEGADLCPLYPRPELRPMAGIRLLVPEGKTEQARSLLSGGKDEEELSVNGAKIYITDCGAPENAGVAGENIRRYLVSHRDDTVMCELFGREFPISGEDRRCAALLSHIGSRLIEGFADLRSLCDWTVFLDSVKDMKAWERWFGTVLKDGGLTYLAIYLTACAEKYLGFTGCPWQVEVSDNAVEALFNALTDAGCAEDVSAPASAAEYLSGMVGRRQTAPLSGREARRGRMLAEALHLFEVAR